METDLILLLGITAFLASLLTFFSGFGLGTILTPVFAIFFPIEVAVAQTAAVHLLNNFFKLALTGKHININLFLIFGLPALCSAFGGAWLLLNISDVQPLWQYELYGKSFHVTLLKAIISSLIIIFSVMELMASKIYFPSGRITLMAGGLLSGFFGGLSGHQGALRSAFLIRVCRTKEEYIATGIAIACLIDMSRILVYTKIFLQLNFSESGTPVAAALLCAFAGAFFGNRFLKKTTFGFIQLLTHGLLIILALLLGAGWI